MDYKGPLRKAVAAGRGMNRSRRSSGSDPGVGRALRSAAGFPPGLLVELRHADFIRRGKRVRENLAAIHRERSGIAARDARPRDRTSILSPKGDEGEIGRFLTAGRLRTSQPSTAHSKDLACP